MAELKIAAAAENLDAVIAFVEEQMHLAGCPARIIAQVDMAVEEIFVNIASYAYQPGTGEAEISCTAAGEPPSVTVRFADSGRPYDPLRRADPDITLSAEERAVGGLGILMVKKLMDETAYEYVDGKNVLTIKKHA